LHRFEVSFAQGKLHDGARLSVCIRGGPSGHPRRLVASAGMAGEHLASTFGFESGCTRFQAACLNGNAAYLAGLAPRLGAA
jgi:hypothetical protein